MEAQFKFSGVFLFLFDSIKMYVNILLIVFHAEGCNCPSSFCETDTVEINGELYCFGRSGKWKSHNCKNNWNSEKEEWNTINSNKAIRNNKIISTDWYFIKNNPSCVNFEVNGLREI